MAATPPHDKVREARLRRMARRQNLTLVKSRRRDQLAADFGKYYIFRLDPTYSAADSVGWGEPEPPEADLVTAREGITIDQVEIILTQRSADR